jgi:hypothetical protein
LPVFGKKSTFGSGKDSGPPQPLVWNSGDLDSKSEKQAGVNKVRGNPILTEMEQETLDSKTRPVDPEPEEEVWYTL